MRKRQDRRRGQAMIESALTLLIFVPVLVGIADFGQVIYVHQTLTDRARAAARYGAVHTYADSGSATIKMAVYNDAGATDASIPMLPSLTTGMVTATLDDPGTDLARITVTISSYPFGFVSGFMSHDTWYRTVVATEPYEIP